MLCVFVELDTYIWSWRATLALAFMPYQCAAVHLSAPIPALLSNSSPLGMLYWKHFTFDKTTVFSTETNERNFQSLGPLR